MTDIDLPDGEYTAVVDAIEDGLATVFFEQDSEEVGSAILDAETLPVEAQHPDAVLSVTIADTELVDVAYDPDRTEERATSAQERFDQLSTRPPTDDDS